MRRACEAAERTIEALDDEGDCHTVEDPMELAQKLRVAGLDCTLTEEAAREIYWGIAARLGAIVEAERAAVAEWRGSAGRCLAVEATPHVTSLAVDDRAVRPGSAI